MKKRERALRRTKHQQWLFVVQSRLGFAVRTTPGYWAVITRVKHPSLAGKEEAVIRTLAIPDEVRISKRDTSVYMFYRRIGNKYLCVVTKRLARNSGFIMTSYFSQKIKEGQSVWKK